MKRPDIDPLDYAYKRYNLMPREEILLYPEQGRSLECYPSLENQAAFKQYFDREGFICIRQAVPRDVCEAAKNAFLAEILPDRRSFFLRHEDSSLTRHVLTEHQFMKYPIMNIQDLPGKKYPVFQRTGLDLLTSPNIRRSVEILLQETGRLIHTMYFDGNQVTWAHRDGHYIDDTQVGGMIGIWVAAEDIQPGAGRFYIVPRSHRMAIPNEQDDPIGVAYKANMAEFVRNGPLSCVSPILQQGDAIIWSSLTVHGSLPTTTPEFSRRSFTGHYIGQSHQFAWRDGNSTARSKTVNGIQVTLHGNQQTLVNNLANTIRADWPRLARLFKMLRAGLSF